MPNSNLYERHSNFLKHRYQARLADIKKMFSEENDIATIYVHFLERSSHNIIADRPGEKSESTVLSSTMRNKTLSLKDEQTLEFVGWPESAITIFKTDLDKPVSKLKLFTQSVPATRPEKASYSEGASQSASVTRSTPFTQSVPFSQSALATHTPATQFNPSNLLRQFGFKSTNIEIINQTPRLLDILAISIPMFMSMNFDVNDVIEILNRCEALEHLLSSLPRLSYLKLDCKALIFQANMKQLDTIINSYQKLIKIKELFLKFNEVMVQFPAERMLEIFDGLNDTDFTYLKGYCCQSLFTYKINLDIDYQMVIKMMLQVVKDLEKPGSENDVAIAKQLYKYLNANLNDLRIYGKPDFPNVFTKLAGFGYSPTTIGMLLRQANQYSCSQALHLTPIVMNIGFTIQEAKRIFEMTFSNRRGGFIIYELISQGVSIKDIKEIFSSLDKEEIFDNIRLLIKKRYMFKSVESFHAWSEPKFELKFPESVPLETVNLLKKIPENINNKRGPQDALQETESQNRNKRMTTTSAFFQAVTNSTPIESAPAPIHPQSAFEPVRRVV